jgi:hypothetical protein
MRSCAESRNRPAAHIVGARNFALRLLTGFEALDRLALLMVGKLLLPSKLHALRIGAFAAVACELDFALLCDSPGGVKPKHVEATEAPLARLTI